MFFLERPAQKPSYVETSYRGWTIRSKKTNDGVSAIMFDGKQSITFSAACHSSAEVTAKEKLNSLVPTVEPKMCRTHLSINFNHIFTKSVISRIGENTGIEFFTKDDALFLRILRKADFRKIKKLHSSNGGCLNIVAKEIGSTTVRTGIKLTDAATFGITAATRYDMTYDSEDARGLIYSVRLNSQIDRDSANNRVAMALPGFTTYGRDTTE